MPRPRVQFGSLQRTGKRIEKWRGHYFEYVDGKRHHKAIVLGNCEDMPELQARRKLIAHIQEVDKQRRLVNVIRTVSTSTSFPLTGPHHHDKGALAELAVSADLLSRGFEVFKAVSGSASCDLIAMAEGQCFRVQVKYSSGERNLRLRRGTFDLLAEVNPNGLIRYTPDDQARVYLEAALASKTA